MYFGKSISGKSNLWTCFVRCQLYLYFSDQIVRQGYLSVCVQGLYRLSKCSTLQLKLIDKQWSLYGIACYGRIIKQNLNLRGNLPTKFKSVMSQDWEKQHSKLMPNSDKYQPTGSNNSCSQLHISSLRPPALGREIGNFLWYIMTSRKMCWIWNGEDVWQ